MKKIFVPLFILVVGFTACKKTTFTEINTDPVSIGPDKIDPNFLLTRTILEYAGSNDQGAEVRQTEIFGAGSFIQHFSSVIPDVWGDKYLRTPDGWGSFYDHIYTNGIKFSVDLNQLTQGKPEYSNLHQISRIMKALIFQKLTDAYGDIPYSQAGLGYYQQIFAPVYDRQKDIYADLMKEVSEATDSLSEDGDKPTGDLIYGGSDDQIAEWKKFGSTLLLRMAMRLTKVNPTTAQEYVQKLSGKLFESNDDNALIKHSGDGGSITQNRISEAIASTLNNRQYTFYAKAFIDTLKNNDDPRLDILAQVDNDSAGQNGLPSGFDQTSTISGITQAPGFLGGLQYYSQPTTTLLGDVDPAAIDYSKPTFVLTYAESELLQADAAVRWGIGDAETHYHNGVVAAMTGLSAYGTGVSSTAAEAWYHDHGYVAANGLDQINTQFWLATILNEYEAWSNWRRTGFPVLTPTNYHGNITGGTIPRRMAYPQSEALGNSANYQAAVQASLPEGDLLTSRIWWDVK